MAKTCVVNRDDNGNITSVLVKNPSTQNTVDPIEFAINRNNGYDLNLAPNGKPSLLHKTYTEEMGMSDMEAKMEVSKVYTDEFFSRFGSWVTDSENSSRVVDENTQPKIVWSGHTEKIENYNAYTNRTAEDRIDNDAFFPEDKVVADSYANAGFQMTREQAEKYKLPYRDAEPVFLNIRQAQTVEENSGLLITPLIEEAIQNGVDGFYGDTIHRTDSKTWSVLDGSQVIPVESLPLLQNTTSETEDTFIPSTLFEEVKQIPFVTEEQALDLYKNIYRPEFENLTENLNELTKEPKLFFQADNGNIYTNLSETLKNSADSYSVGFMNNEGNFQSFLEAPVYSETDVKGKTQSLIKNDYLKPTEKESNTFEAQDSLSAEMVEEDLILYNPEAYTRNGNNFTIQEPQPIKTLNQMIRDFGLVNGVRTALANKYFDLKNKANRPKEVLYNEEQLYNAIQSFMKKVGISETTIENYKERYKAKFGIEADANAFIDINNKIIATVDGRATLDELSEEVSHFIIEAWNRDEIMRLLPYVKNTSYYAQFAETYREIYSKQISDKNEVERYVEKEILGKMLAESLKTNFTLENKTDLERNFFQRLGDILRGFIEYIQSKVTPKEVNDIEFFTKQVSNLLYNQELEANLERLNPQSTAQIMYSVPDSMSRLLDRFGRDITRSASEMVSEEELAIQGAVSIFNDRLSRASSLLREVRKYTGDDAGIMPSSTTLLAEALLADREALELLRSASIRTARSTPNTTDRVNTIRQIADTTLQALSELSGEMQSITDKEPSVVLRELLQETGETRQYVIDAMVQNVENTDDNGVRQAQKDTNQINRLFGHVGKMSNAFVTLLNTIIKRMYNNAVIDTNDDFKEYAEKLIPFRNIINKFYKGGNFISVVDSEKVRESKLKYEYNIRKELGDSALEELSEEDFLSDYENVSKIEKGTNMYYAYDYLYKKNYSSQDWAEEDRVEYNDNFIKNIEEIALEEDLRNGNSAIYVTLKNYSDRRSKYREGDPLRKSENEQIAIDRKTTSNIFHKDGTLKEGLSYMRYAVAKSRGVFESDIVSTNPKKTPTENDFVVVIDRSIAEPTIGALTFDMLKWNSLNLSERGDATVLKENFRKEYNKKLKSLENLPANERNTQLREWVKENLQFDMSDEYWESLDFEGINFSGLRDVVTGNIEADLNRKETELNTLKLQRANILKLYKIAGDYKEIDSEKIPSEDKLIIEKLEIEILNKKNEINRIFDEYEIPMYTSESTPIVELNQSFYEVFEKTIGTRYETSTLAQKKAFFSGQYGMSAEKYSMFLNFEKLLTQTNSLNSSATKQINKYRNLANSSSVDAIKEAYLKANAPTWYKRYDANTEYGNFLRDFNTGVLSTEELVNDYLSTGEFRYNGQPLNMMQINPAFKFTLARPDSTQELYEQYTQTTNLKDKFNLLMQMGGVDKLKNVAKEDVSFIVNNEENLKAYTYMMDYHLRSLDASNSLNQYNVFLRPQQRKGELERYETFFTKGDKLSQIKDGLKEKFQYREDDFIDAYRDEQIPKYGLYRLKPEELTDDILGSLIWFNKQSNVYKSKLESYSKATRALSALEHQDFEKGKKSTDTNYYKIMREMIDYNYFGKTTTMKMETNIMGQKVDMAKVLMWFKGFAIKQALGFAPIVALTNVTSGITQNQFLKWTGKNVFSDADDRALKIIAPLTSDSIRDIGDFNPGSKLNKLLYQFGVYDIEDRFRNAKFNRTARLLPESAFGMMAIGNFVMQSRVTVAKLMEIRLIDGKFQSWRDYLLEQKRLDKNQTDKEIKSKFNEASTRSMYDYLDDSGVFNNEKLKEDGYNGDIRNDKSKVISRIQDISEQVTMEIQKHNEGQSARDPLWSFALSLKKWLILANTNMFSRKRIDPESGGYEEGLIFSYKYMFDLLQRARKENVSLAQAYEELEEYEKKNLRSTAIITASMTVLLGMAFMLKKLADDDDEKDNYLLQLANYQLLRNLSETFSANIGLGNSLFESLQSPIMVGSTVKNLTKMVNFEDIGETATSGKYAGVDKYLANFIKLTQLKNIYTVKDANTLYETRKGYEFFSAQNSLYSIFSMLPKKDKEE